MVEEDFGHAREDGKREYYHKGSKLLKPKHISTFTNDDISRLPRSVTGFLDVGWKGGGRSPPPPLSTQCTLLGLLFRNYRPPTRGLGRPAAANGQEGSTQYIAALQLPYIYLPFPFSGNPLSSQYLDTLLSYWLGLSLVPISYHIPNFVAVARSMGPRWLSSYYVIEVVLVRSNITCKDLYRIYTHCYLGQRFFRPVNRSRIHERTISSRLLGMM
jgi:hypothetical protein